MDNFYHIAAATLSPNAGHTFYEEGVKKVTKQLPVTGGWNNNKRVTIYLTAGSVIDIDLLFEEIEKFNIDPNRIVIHPRAAIITKENKEEEKSVGGVESIASTQSGTGSARASKIMRKNPLAMNVEKIKKMVGILPLHDYLRQGLSVIVETGQGVDLGLDHGLAYPYVTSRDVLPVHVLDDLGVHPKFLGNVMLTFRTYPIRVGNIVRDGSEIGNSGPFWDDQKEITWGELGIEPERTTVTNRIRRVATFSVKQYHHSIDLVQPSHIFLNFINYIKENDLKLFRSLNPKPTYVGYGPAPDQIKKYDKHIFKNVI